MPLIPHAVYLVENADDGYYRFYGKIGMLKLLGLLSAAERTGFLISILMPVLGRIALFAMAILLIGGAMSLLR